MRGIPEDWKGGVVSRGGPGPTETVAPVFFPLVDKLAQFGFDSQILNPMECRQEGAPPWWSLGLAHGVWIALPLGDNSLGRIEACAPSSPFWHRDVAL